MLLHNQSDDLNGFARQLASLPFDFDIVIPASLRSEVAALAKRLLQIASLR